MKVMLRVEGGPQMGMGHVMRCLTLGRALAAQGAQVEFMGTAFACRAVRRYWPGVRCHVLPALPEMPDARRCRVLLQREGCDWVVVDHYLLGVRWEREVKRAGVALLAIDDVGREHDCDVLMDSKPGAMARYRFRGVRLFGPRYALLREGFRTLRLRAAQAKEPRLFICFGGSDPEDMTGFCVKALQGALPVNAAVDVVVGLGYQRAEALAKACGAAGFALHVGHCAPEELMAQATLAVGAGGTMNWERCVLGLPAVVITLAENQRAQTAWLQQAGALCWLGDAGAVGEAPLREAVLALLAGDANMAQRARAQLDGKGAWRVARYMGAYV